ncbi:hypothetical protein HDA44_002237 [Kribbella solani]|uniref:Uncharacterized protein n=1 Tax=Kribbella solani TaxID=236067 RepID=A0A841DQ68_9ACTN|nr:hypothetical protein [Kribbella solani]
MGSARAVGWNADRPMGGPAVLGRPGGTLIG